MLVKANKLKRDYQVSYEYAVSEDSVLYNKVFYTRVKDCYNRYQAFEQVVDKIEQLGYRLRDWYCEPVKKTHRDLVNAEVYELVLAELFDGDIGVYEYIDLQNGDYEFAKEVEGIDKIFIEHEAYVKWTNR